MCGDGERVAPRKWGMRMNVNFAPTPVNRPLRILLVEATKNNQLLIQAYLKAGPYQLELADNGAIAVQRFISGVIISC